MTTAELVAAAPGTQEAVPELEKVLEAETAALHTARTVRDETLKNKQVLLDRQARLNAQDAVLLAALNAEQPIASAGVLAAIDDKQSPGALITALRKCNAKRAEIVEAMQAVETTLDVLVHRSLPEADIAITQAQLDFTNAAKRYLEAEAALKLTELKIATEPIRKIDPTAEISCTAGSLPVKLADAISERALSAIALTKELDARRSFARMARNAKGVRELVGKGDN